MIDQGIDCLIPVTTRGHAGRRKQRKRLSGAGHFQAGNAKRMSEILAGPQFVTFFIENLYKTTFSPFKSVSNRRH